MARGELPGGRETWELILQNDRKGLSLLLKHGNGTTTMGPSPPEVVVRGVEALSVASNVNFQRDHAFVFGFSAEPVANIRIELKTRPAIGVRPIDAPGFPFNVFVRQLGALGETPVIAALDAGGNVLHRETKPGKSGSANTVPP